MSSTTTVRRSFARMVAVLVTAVPAFGQAAAPDPDLPPIATSRFAVPASSFRELRGLGEPAPAPIPGETLHGEPIASWPKDRVTLLLFWSPYVTGNDEHLGRLAEVGRDRDHIEVASVGLGPRDRIEAQLDALQTRRNEPPRTIVDPGNEWRKTMLGPLGLTELPAIVAIDGDGNLMYHGSVRASPFVLGGIVDRSFDPRAYRRDALEYGARQNALRIIAAERARAGRGEISRASVLDTIQEAISLDPENTLLRVQHFDTLLLDADRIEQAYEVGRGILDEFATSPLTLNDLAWHVVSYRGVARRDLDFALEASRRANAIQGWLDPSMLDTLARVHWLRGDASEAVRIQRIAAGLAPDTWHGDDIRANLAAYTDGSVPPGELPPPVRAPRPPR